MSAIPLLAQRTFAYAGQSVQAGQRFVAVTDADAVVLKAIGHAVDAPEDSSPLPDEWQAPSVEMSVVVPKRKRKPRVTKEP